MRAEYSFQRFLPACQNNWLLNKKRPRMFRFVPELFIQVRVYYGARESPALKSRRGPILKAQLRLETAENRTCDRVSGR
jgi:hypothetical protein